MILVEGGCFAPYVTESRSQNQKKFLLESGIQCYQIGNGIWNVQEWNLKFTSELVSKSIAEYKYARWPRYANIASVWLNKSLLSTS